MQKERHSRSLAHRKGNEKNDDKSTDKVHRKKDNAVKRTKTEDDSNENTRKRKRKKKDLKKRVKEKKRKRDYSSSSGSEEDEEIQQRIDKLKKRYNDRDTTVARDSSVNSKSGGRRRKEKPVRKDYIDVCASKDSSTRNPDFIQNEGDRTKKHRKKRKHKKNKHAGSKTRKEAVSSSDSSVSCEGEEFETVSKMPKSEESAGLIPARFDASLKIIGKTTEAKDIGDTDVLCQEKLKAYLKHFEQTEKLELSKSRAEIIHELLLVEEAITRRKERKLKVVTQLTQAVSDSTVSHIIDEGENESRL